MRNKLLRCLIAVILLFSIGINVNISSYAAEGMHWYLKRCHGQAPKFPENAEDLKQYDVYFIDEKVTEEDKKLYITFDAGYENGNISKILDILKEEQIPAAFFLLDNIILKNTDLVIRMADEGHLVCNHTKNHKNLSCASEEEIKNNLSALEDIYKEKTGRAISKYFRFPEGRYSIEALKCIYNMGYKTVFWSFAYDDWDNRRQPNNEKAIKKVLENTHNGAVLLFHPTSNTNVEIFPKLIEEWRKMGYSFGTLDELTK